MHDLVIRNGTVVDGRGGTPVLADVAVDDGRITAVGSVPDPGREELDATGLVVTPGFVDVHTHYDGQVTWDPLLTPSLWHGVTTVVMGNCGVGFAPAAPDRHDWLIGLMEGVEGIPGASLREAIKWDWQSVPEYMDALDRIPRALDVAVQVPHGAVRAYVMGERGAANEPATDDDIGRMADLVAEGVDAGAVGVSANRLELHKAVDGREVPGTFATAEELTALDRAPWARVRATRSTARSCPAPPAATARCGTASSTCSRPRRARRGVAITFAFGGSSGSDWRDRLARMEQENANGARIVPQVSSHGQGSVLRAAHVAPVPRSPVVRRHRAPAGRRARRRAWPSPTCAPPSSPSGPPPGVPRLRDLMLAQADAVFPSHLVPVYEPDPSTSLAAQSAAHGRDPEELLYEWTIADDGDALVHYFLGGYAGSLDVRAELLVHPETVLGLGDGGAHVDLICDAGYPSFLLSYWVRDRPRGTHAARDRGQGAHQRAGRRLRPARPRRGRARAEGRPQPRRPGRRRARARWRSSTTSPPARSASLQRTDGFVATIVDGQVVQRDGVDTGARPGRVVRSTS